MKVRTSNVEPTSGRSQQRELAVVLIIAMALMLLPRLVECWAVEQWTLRFLWRAFESPRSTAELAAPPLSHTRASVWLARTALQAGDPAGAFTLAQPLAAQGDLLALDVMGSALAAQGDLTGALQAWEQAGEYQSLAALAERAVAEECLDVARAAYKAAYANFPQGGILTRANFLWQTAQDPLSAESLLRQALQEYPSASRHPSWLLLLADILRVQGRWDEAEETLLLMLEEDPAQWRAYIGLGQLYYERGDGAKIALAQLRQSIAINPEQNEGYFAIGAVLINEERFAEADSWFALALVRNPESRWWYVRRGEYARGAGNLALAVEVFQVAIERFPEYSLAYYELAWTYRLNEQPAEAVEAIEQALALMDPPDVSYYVRAGIIYEWAGEPAKGLAAYRAALALNPEHEGATQGVSRLADNP